jgi:hypothetical protein
MNEALDSEARPPTHSDLSVIHPLTLVVMAMAVGIVTLAKDAFVLLVSQRFAEV